MKLIVGLGNPGEKYKYNRHNIGFLVLDNLISSLGLAWTDETSFFAQICKDKDTIYCKPQTFMNESGKSVAKIVSFYKIPSGELTVVHDDVDLPFGKMKKQIGAGSAGHHGVASIINSVGTKDFWRIRVGVGRPNNPDIDTEDWVLMNFSEEEFREIPQFSLDTP